MTLLVVGLVAVIVVILIAVFLSTRTGRGDDHEVARTRPSDRDRRRSELERWRERGSDVREGDRGRSGGHPSGRGGPDRRSGAREPVPAYSERPVRRRELPAGRSRDYDEPQRGPRRHDSDAIPGYDSTPSRRALPARARSDGRGRYDSQPLPRVAGDDFPSADYPSMDFPPDELVTPEPAPVARPAARPAPPTVRDPNQDSRRKPARAAHGDGGAKGRSRALRGRHDDDDDWPSTEWDKLSDEQYWKELSADKPVSSMNPPPAGDGAKPATSNKPAPVAGLPSRAAKQEPAPAEPGPIKPMAAPPGRDQARELPSRKARAPREAVTERLPVRPRPQRAPAQAAIEAPRTPRRAPVTPAAANPVSPVSPVPAGLPPMAQAPIPAAAGPRDSGDQGLAMLADLGKTTSAAPNVRDDDPLTSPSFSRKALSATDSRSYGNARKNGSANPSLTGLERDRKNAGGRGKHRAAQSADEDAAMMPLAAPPAQHPSGPYPVAPAAAANGRYPAAPGQIPATARPAQQPGGPYPAAAPQASNGYGAGHPSGPYPVAHPNGGYAQDAASSGSWYNMPADAANAAGQGVSYASAGAARAPGGFADGHAAAGYAGGPDYAAPSYRGQAYTDPGSLPGLPVRRGRGKPAEAVSHPSFPRGQPGREPPWDGHPDQAPYPAGYGNGEYAEGSDSHRGEPYQADGYGGYAARG